MNKVPIAERHSKAIVHTSFSKKYYVLLDGREEILSRKYDQRLSPKHDPDP
jgi:hypothetical protein